MASGTAETPVQPSAPEISREEILVRRGDPSLVLLNVLPREAFAAGHIPGSVSLPVAEIPARARKVLPNPTQEVVVYCAAST
jgi:rhodanese-related sulfurtransferase